MLLDRNDVNPNQPNVGKPHSIMLPREAMAMLRIFVASGLLTVFFGECYNGFTPGEGEGVP